MKKQLLFLAILCTSILSSCGSDDDGDSSSILGTIRIENQTFDVNTALIGDFGIASPLFDASHYNFDFTLTDAVFNLSNPQTNQDFTGTYILYAELFSPGTSGFQTGTFNYVDDFDIEQSDIDGEFIFFASDLILDSNNDGVIDESDTEDAVVSGSITVSGSGTNYTITYDVELESGKTINTSFSGNFTLF